MQSSGDGFFSISKMGRLVVEVEVWRVTIQVSLFSLFFLTFSQGAGRGREVVATDKCFYG